MVLNYIMCLLIPAAGIYAPVFEVGSKIWQIDAATWAQQPLVLDTEVGWVHYSALPGAGGNIVLDGHTPGPLTGMEVVEVGDIIVLLRGNQMYWYMVTAVYPEETSTTPTNFLEQGPPERVTIITCNGEYRLVVVAERK